MTDGRETPLAIALRSGLPYATSGAVDTLAKAGSIARDSVGAQPTHPPGPERVA